MPEDNLPRRARETRQRYEKARELFFLQKASLPSIKAAIDDRAAQAKEKLAQAEERNNAGDIEGAKELYEEAVALIGDTTEIAKVEEETAEITAAVEEVMKINMEAEIEGSKLRSEALKQQATFSAGAIVGIAAITRGVLPTYQIYTPLLYIAYVLLLLTISMSLSLINTEAWRVELTLRSGELEHRGKLHRMFYYFAAGGFSTSVLVFAVFMTANLAYSAGGE